MDTSSSALSIADVPDHLFEFLRQMDAEAITLMQSGNPAGLSDYGRHARPDLRKPQNEVEWSRRIAQLLLDRGVPTELEREYPNQDKLPKRKRKRRDLHLTLLGNHKMSIEIKGAWSDYWGRTHRIYRSYLLHPLLPGLDATKEHTVPFDLMRLSKLGPPETDYIAQLLVGFERPEDPMDADVDELIALAGLETWEQADESWMSATVPGQRVRSWFWLRTAGDGWTLTHPGH